MKVLGYDPQITVQRAWQLSSSVEQALSLDDLFARARRRSRVHVPLNDAHARARERRAPAARCSRGGVLLNFARAAIVDEAGGRRRARRRAACTPTSATSRRTRCKDHPQVVTLPHLGASTGEAEENCAVMVAEQLRDFLENGNITQQRELSRGGAAARARHDPARDRQQQRAEHGRPDLHLPGRRRAQHRRPAQQVARRVRLHAHRRRRGGGRAGAAARSARIEGVLSARLI